MQDNEYKLFMEYNEIKNELIEVCSRFTRRYDSMGYICNGGIVLAMELARIMPYYIHTYIPIIVSSYEDNEIDVRKENISICLPEEKVKICKNMLIVDDICDTGETLKLVTSYIRQINDQCNIDTLVLIYKSNKSTFRPTYYVFEDTEDRWWSGFGMDPLRSSKHLWFKVR